MADQKKRVSELPESSSTKGLYTLGVNASNESVKVPLGEILDGITPKVNQAVSTANSAKSEAAIATSTANDAKTTAENAKSLSTDASGRAQTATELAEKAKTFASEGSTARFDGFVDRASIMLASYGGSTVGEVIFVRYSKVFAYKVDGKYYNNWAVEPNADLFFPNNSRVEIRKDKAYICNGKLYIWDNELNDLIIAGTDSSEVDDKIKEAVYPRQFYNANKLLDNYNAMSLDVVLGLLYANDEAKEYKTQGVVITFLGTDGKMETYQWNGNNKADFTDAETWSKFGSGSATVGNCYNVTNEQPISGYYDLETAITATYNKGFSSVGMQITFAIAKNSWKTYQYVGSDTESTNFKNTQLWLDLAGMSAGAETLINVDALCGACTSASFYTLEYAISAITKLQTDSGINYAKSGLVITYKIGENTWETKQFKGEASDFGEASLWHEFGGAGGSKVETKEEPQEDGKDAFSTGGAYKYVPTNLHVDTETEGVIKISMVNAKGETVGDEQQFAVGTGSGESSGTIVRIIPESAPLYAKAA